MGFGGWLQFVRVCRNRRRDAFANASQRTPTNPFASGQANPIGSFPISIVTHFLDSL